jgi:hypothetical protein
VTSKLYSIDLLQFKVSQFVIPKLKVPFIILHQLDEAKKIVAIADVLPTSRNPKIREAYS